MRTFLSSTTGMLVIGAVLLAVAAVLPLLNLSLPGILPGPTYTPGALSMLAYAFLISALALSYHLIFGIGGMLSFGHAMFFSAGAYGLGIALNLLAPTAIPEAAVFVLAIVATLVVALVAGNLVGALALRVTGISFAMVTLAFAQAVNVMLRRDTGGLTGGEEGVTLEVAVVPDLLIGVQNARNVYWLALGILVLVYLACVWIEKSRLGHVVVASRENELRVTVLGLRPYTVRLFIFGAGAVFAAVAGMGFLLLQSTVTPRISTADFTLTLLVIVVLGGVGYRWGAIIGGILYTLLDQRLASLASASWIAELPAVLRIPLSEPLFLLGMLFVLVVMFAPGGIVGLTQRVTRRRDTATERPEALTDART
ncbi:branched-chain amino acid ABC transporter permease [Brachybacterium vulturis]|uniref:branched-chain amino acid ABC transporter permease n=1 Tax=Brachybacterium vulturis TaxID=2017484 RepID=UPI0037365D0D